MKSETKIGPPNLFKRPLMSQYAMDFVKLGPSLISDVFYERVPFHTVT